MPPARDDAFPSCAKRRFRVRDRRPKDEGRATAPKTANLVDSAPHDPSGRVRNQPEWLPAGRGAALPVLCRAHARRRCVGLASRLPERGFPANRDVHALIGAASMRRDIEKQRGRIEKTLKFARWCSKLVLFGFWSVLVAGILLMLVVLTWLVSETGFPPLDEPGLYMMAVLGLSHAGVWYGLIRFFGRSFRQRIARYEAELDALCENPEMEASA